MVENLNIVYKNLDDLIDNEYNPKSLSPKQENEIAESIKTFGIVDPFIINTYKGRENIIVGGHQRKKVCKSLGISSVPCVEVCLPLEEEKELCLRLTANQGSIDEALLAINYSKEMIKRVGLECEKIKEVASEFEKKFNEVNNTNCVYPIVPKFSEKYDALIIVSKNETDTAFLKTIFNVKKAQSYKNQRTGEAMVLDVEQIRKAWEESR